MKNLRNILKKFTAVMMLAAILFAGSNTVTTLENPNDGIMTLGGGAFADVLEF